MRVGPGPKAVPRGTQGRVRGRSRPPPGDPPPSTTPPPLLPGAPRPSGVAVCPRPLHHDGASTCELPSVSLDPGVGVEWWSVGAEIGSELPGVGVEWVPGVGVEAPLTGEPCGELCTLFLPGGGRSGGGSPSGPGPWSSPRVPLFVVPGPRSASWRGSYPSSCCTAPDPRPALARAVPCLRRYLRASSLGQTLRRGQHSRAFVRAQRRYLPCGCF